MWKWAFKVILFSYLNANVVHPSRLVLLQEAGNRAFFPEWMEELQFSVAKLNKHCVHTMIRQRHLVAHLGPQHISIKGRGLLHVRNSNSNVIQPPQVPQWWWDALAQGRCHWVCPDQWETWTSRKSCHWETCKNKVSWQNSRGHMVVQEFPKLFEQDY